MTSYLVKTVFTARPVEGSSQSAKPTHRVRPKLTVVERDLNEAIVTAVLRQSGFPSQRTVAVVADQVFKSVFIAGAPIKKTDPTIWEVE